MAAFEDMNYDKLEEAFDETIIEFMRRKYEFGIGKQTAKEIKKNLVVACVKNEEATLECRGRDLNTGLPKIAEITVEMALEDLILLKSEKITRYVNKKKSESLVDKHAIVVCDDGLTYEGLVIDHTARGNGGETLTVRCGNGVMLKSIEDLTKCFHVEE